MLSNITYTGKTYYGMTKRISKTKVIQQPSENWILLPDITPPIILEELFKRTHEVMEKTKQSRPIKKNASYLLTGFIKCSKCGSSICRLSDKIGRKKVIYLTALPVVASYIMLIYAPNSIFLIASGALQGFFMITGIVTTAMARELVPAEHMGRWTGILGLGRMGLAAIMTYVCGLIWDHVGPQYVFWFIMIFYVIRLPLPIGMPETLVRKEKTA
jgi:fucose permease